MRGAVIHPRIFKELGCPDRVKIISNDETREVVVTAKCEDSVTEEQDIHAKINLAKRGCRTETFSTGSPLYKGKSGVHRSHARRSKKRRRHCFESLCRKEITWSARTLSARYAGHHVMIYRWIMMAKILL